MFSGLTSLFNGWMALPGALALSLGYWLVLGRKRNRVHIEEWQVSPDAGKDEARVYLKMSFTGGLWNWIMAKMGTKKMQAYALTDSQITVEETAQGYYRRESFPVRPIRQVTFGVYKPLGPVVLSALLWLAIWIMLYSCLCFWREWNSAGWVYLLIAAAVATRAASRYRNDTFLQFGIKGPASFNWYFKPLLFSGRPVGEAELEQAALQFEIAAGMREGGTLLRSDRIPSLPIPEFHPPTPVHAPAEMEMEPAPPPPQPTASAPKPVDKPRQAVEPELARDPASAAQPRANAFSLRPKALIAGCIAVLALAFIIWLAARPSAPVDYREKARQAEAKGDLMSALDSYQVLVKQNPQDAQAWKAMGHLYYRQDQKKYARQCFDQYLKLEPGDKDMKKWVKKLM